MVSFEEWEEFDDITTEFAPAQYEKQLRKSISESNSDTMPELSLMAIRADAEQGRLSDFTFEAGQLMRQPVGTRGTIWDL